MKSRPLITKNEPKWSLMRKVIIPDIADHDRDYLVRWRIIQTPWFGIFLHKILLPDNDRNLHDHPWNFYSIILKGAYNEKIQPWSDYFFPDLPKTYHRPRWSGHGMNMYDFHQITKLYRVPTWTLVFVGKKSKGWGFKTEKGYIDHREYDWQQHNGD